MWPSASVRAAAKPASSSSATALPVDAATWTNSRYRPYAMPRCTGARADEPAQRARSGGQARQSLPTARRGSGRPARSRSAGRSRLPPVEAVHRERKRRGHLVARLADHAAHQGIEDRLAVAGVHAPGHLGREPREHVVGTLDVAARKVALERSPKRSRPGQVPAIQHGLDVDTRAAGNWIPLGSAAG
jgi:hypothetical protein